MKKLMVGVFAAVAAAVAWADLITDYEGLSAAIGAAEEGSTIKLKAGTIAFSAPLAVSKGITLSGGWTDESTREDDAMTTFDGADSVNLLVLNHGAGKTVTVERVILTRAREQGLKKEGRGDLIVDSCEFLANGANWENVGGSNGRGLYAYDDTKTASVTVRNTLFAGNVSRNASTSDRVYGGAAYIRGNKRAEFVGSRFHTNGLAAAALSHGYSYAAKNGVYGAGIYSEGGVLHLRGCEFRGNVSTPVDWTQTGSIVLFYGACSGSTVSNCLFVGNQDFTTSWRTFNGGAIGVDMSSSSDTLDIDGCTVAYNTCNSPRAAAGLTVNKGTVKVGNSIFYGNRIYSGSSGVPEIATAANGFVNVSYSLLTAEKTCLGNVNLGSGICYGDPQFVTPLSEFTDLIRVLPNNTFEYLDPSDEAQAKVMAFDVHLKSKLGYRTNAGEELKADVNSIALDRGDPAAPYGDEPEPNGYERNLGFYGTTSAASKSVQDAPEIDSVGIEFPDGLSAPCVTVALGGGEGAGYGATLTIYSGTEDASPSGEWMFTNVVYAVRSGKSVAVDLGAYLTAGQTYYVRAEAAVPGHETAVKTAQAQVTGEIPIWQGHGGGPNVLHVRAGAKGAMTGANWTEACPDLVTALRALTSAKTEIWIAGDPAVPDVAALQAFGALKVRGGFRGCEDSVAERPAGAVSTLDGADACDLLTIGNEAGRPVTIERVRFVRAKQHALQKTGAGDLVLDTCEFLANGTAVAPCDGRGLWLSGATASTTVTLTNCLFAGNVAPTVFKDQDRSYGGGVYAVNLKRLVADDCRFLTNGVALAVAGQGTGGGGRNGFPGAAIYANNAPLTLRGCEFRGNVARSTDNTGVSGTVTLWGSSGGSAFTNCVFAGNENWPTSWEWLNGGAIDVWMGTAAATLDVYGCTIAYNLDNSPSGAAGICAEKGAVTVRDSVFWGNRVKPNVAAVADLMAGSEGSIRVSYTLLSASTSIGGATVPVEGVIYGDPSFVTPASAFEDLVDFGSKVSFKTGADVPAAVCALDVHLRSRLGYWTNGGAYVASGDVNSVALDKGGPADDYSRELEPNGSRLNLGAYGNTAEASHSVFSLPTVDSVTIGYPTPWTQPGYDVTLGGEEGASYDATVQIVTMAADGTAYTNTVAGLGKGARVSCLAPGYFQPEEVLSVEVRVLVNGADPVVVRTETTVDATKSLPPWYGHGSKTANVVHLRAGATGRGTGLNWTDAFADLGNALAALKDGKDELWIAGEVVLGASAPALAATGPVVLRGGFTGVEDTAEARPAGRRSVLDGANAFDTLTLGNGSGAKVSVERMDFVRARLHGVTKTGAGDVEFSDCGFSGNGAYSVSNNGLGANLSGSGATVTFTNCVFAGNVSRQTENVPSDNRMRGAGIYAEGLAALVVEDTLFITNGMPFGIEGAAGPSYQGLYGAAIACRDTKTLVRRCVFRGNIARCMDNGGGIVSLENKCGGSSFEHCLFAGNANHYAQWQTGAQDGCIFATFDAAASELEVRACTFAYNLGNNQKGAAGVSVTKGRLLLSDSLFRGNRLCTGAQVGEDLSLGANATASVRYTLFSSTNAVTSTTEENLALGDGVIFGDARLVTEDVTVITNTPYLRFGGTPEALEEMTTVNAHLRSRTGYVDETTGELVRHRGVRSPAIDAGDPESPYKAEPSPNGLRVNLGFYGNTPWASMSKGGLLLFVK